MNIIKNITFIVITYNHSDYILEHLESIKYLVDNYSDGIDIDIIIADDASQDDTLMLSETWLKKNTYLFRKITVLSDGINRGTCKNLTRAFEYLATDYCKITAGDDVYSCENLFTEVMKIDCNHILSGLPLHLVNGTILPTKSDIFNLFATNIIYKRSEYITKLKRINFFNSPSILYTVPALLNKEVINFVDRYCVTEDWPLQIKMAELYSPLKFVQIEKILVYYRRTGNSTYILKNTQFTRDKVDIFNYLIDSERSVFEKLLLRNRLFCFNLGKRYLKRVLNLSFYMYGFNILKNIFIIMSKVKKFDTQLVKHQNHYDLIASKAREFKFDLNEPRCHHYKLLPVVKTAN